jgi:N-acetylglucosamine kinase-like BadF-type ATPase
MSATTTVIGLDLGGSKTHGVIAPAAPAEPSSPTREMLAGSANITSVGAAEVTRQLSTLFECLGQDGIGAVCAGAAGVDTPEQERRLYEIIQDLVPRALVRIVHDTHLILAAAGVEHGIALIAGTGSVAWARTPDGRTARAGGWGYLLGDEGRQPDRLAQQLAADCGLQSPGELLDHFYATPERRYWAGHSRLVFEQAAVNDPAAVGIVDRAADALAELIVTVGRRVGEAGPVVLGGGLVMHQALLQDRLRQRLKGAGLTDIRVLDRDPVHGAVHLARELNNTRPRV